MSNKTTNIVYIQTAQALKEVTANAYFDAASPATFYGRNAAACGGLVWGYYGATLNLAGVPTQVPNGTLTITDNTPLTYVEMEQTDGSVHQNILGWTPGRTPLYTLTTVSGQITNYFDYRLSNAPSKSVARLSASADSAFQFDAANSDAVILSGSPTIGITITVPPRSWVCDIVNTTGQIATFSTGAGSTVAIGAGKAARILCDGSQVIRITADV